MPPPFEDREVIKALLVDDDIAYLEVLKFFIEREGRIEGSTATSAKQALGMLSETRYDAIVSDYLMPDMDGLELLKIVRLQGMDIPFIMLTGRGREDVAIQALNHGADFYIQKGGDPKTQYADLSNMIKRSVYQRRAERSIREGELLLERFFESVQDGVCILSADLVIERANPSLERWYAHSMPILGKKCYNAYHGRSEPCDSCPTVTALKSGRMSSERIERRGPDGETVGMLEVFSFPLRDEKTGSVERVIEYMRDVTEEDAAKKALRDIEHKYSALMNLASDGIIAIDANGIIVSANPGICSILGYQASEMIGKTVSSLVDPAWLRISQPGLLHRTLEHGDRIELPMMRKDGSRAMVLVAASPMSSERGLYGGAMAVLTDISELRSALERLLSSEEKFAKVFQDSPQLVMITRSGDRTILEANESMARVSGYSRDQLLGRSCVELRLLDEEVVGAIESTLRAGGSVRDLETELRDSSGEMHPLRLAAYGVGLRREECLAYVGTDMSSDPAGVRDLRRERDILRAVLESTPDGIVITDLDGNVVECNTATLEMLGGIPKERMVGSDIFSFLSSDDGMKARRIREKLHSEGVIRGISFILTREDRIRVHADVSAAVVYGPARTPAYLVGVIRDATDVVRYRTALEESLEDRRKLSSIVNQSPAVAFLWRNEPRWPVEYVSDNVIHFGYESGELTSGYIDYASIIHPDDLERVSREVEAQIESGSENFEQEYRLVSPDGKISWVYNRISVIRDEEGEVESLQGVVVDITENKRAQERLSRTERQLKLFMDNSPVIGFMKDRQGRYVYVNRKHQELFGAKSSEWIGKTDMDLFPEEVAERLTGADREVFETGSPIQVLETLPLEGGPREYLTYKFLVPDIAGDEDMLAGVAVDLTEERRYERALRAANEKLNLLGTMTRHDITNQLTVISGWLEAIGEGEHDPDTSRRIADMKVAAESISSLLKFTSEYQALGVKEPTWTDVRDAFMSGTASLRTDSLGVEVEVRGVQVYADQMLEGVFRNLVDNSLRHGGTVSRVSLRYEVEGRSMVLVYEDDGVGIPSEAKGRIFDRGFGKNTGLGLFMAREVLSLTDMTIREVGEEGKGVRFEIVVPEGSYRISTGKS